MEQIVSQHMDYVNKEVDELLEREKEEAPYFLDKRFTLPEVRFEGDNLEYALIYTQNFSLHCQREEDKYCIRVCFVRESEFKKKHVGEKLVSLLNHLGTNTLNKELISNVEWIWYIEKDLTPLFLTYRG